MRALCRRRAAGAPFLARDGSADANPSGLERSGSPKRSASHALSVRRPTCRSSGRRPAKLMVVHQAAKAAMQRKGRERISTRAEGRSKLPRSPIGVYAPLAHRSRAVPDPRAYCRDVRRARRFRARPRGSAARRRAIAPRQDTAYSAASSAALSQGISRVNAAPRPRPSLAAVSEPPISRAPLMAA